MTYDTWCSANVERSTAGVPTGHQRYPARQWRESQANESLRLVVTDPLHPVVEATITGLKRRYRHCAVIGVQHGATVPPPPALAKLVACPPPTAAGYAEAVAAIAVREGAEALLPWTDADALALAPLAGRLRAQGVALVCPPASLVALACDKWATLEQLASAGVQVPPTLLVRVPAGLVPAAERLGYPARSLVVKPRDLAGGRGAWTLRSGFDLTTAGPRPELPLAALAAAVELLGEGAWRDLLVQQEVRGTDVSIDVLAEDGQPLGWVVRTREATLGGLCVQGRVFCRPTELDGLTAQVVAALGWSGLANVQLIVDPQGVPWVYEVNGRAAGSIAAGAHAGVDLLYAAVEHARTGTVPDGALAGGSAPVGFRRYWQDHCWPLPQAGPSRPVAQAISQEERR